jgi:hypothetical protein
MLRRAEPIVLPGGLILLWCLWLIGSWALTLRLRAPVQPSSATFEPGVRMLLLCVGLGLVIGWPLLRLSQEPVSRPGRHTLVDLISLIALMQVVLWLGHLLTSWSAARTAAIDAMLAGWAALAGALVAAATGGGRAMPRNLAMLMCVFMSVLGPAAMWMGWSPTYEPVSTVARGPLLGVTALTHGGSTLPTPEQWQAVAIVWAAALAAWAVFAAVSAARRDHRSGAAAAGAAEPE